MNHWTDPLDRILGLTPLIGSFGQGSTLVFATDLHSMGRMSANKFVEVVERIHAEDPTYAKGAYEFVRLGLNFTLTHLQKEGTLSGRGHISGGQLLEGLKLFALDQFGPLTLTVFEEWNIRSCPDFGRIVFKLVEHGVLGKRDSDSMEDFEGGYDFHEAFAKLYEPQSNPARSS